MVVRTATEAIRTGDKVSQQQPPDAGKAITNQSGNPPNRALTARLCLPAAADIRCDSNRSVKHS